MEEPQEKVTNQQDSRRTKRQQDTLNRIELERAKYQEIKHEPQIKIALNIEDVADLILGAWGVSDHSVNNINIGENGRVEINLNKDQ